MNKTAHCFATRCTQELADSYHPAAHHLNHATGVTRTHALEFQCIDLNICGIGQDPLIFSQHFHLTQPLELVVGPH